MITLEAFVRPIMDIKKGEWSKTLLSFLYFYLTITAYYILKPARNSLYINYLGANNIPYAGLLIAIISYFVIVFYTLFSRKYDNNKIVTGFLLASVGCLIFFRWAFHADYGQTFAAIVSFVFYVWLTLFNSITVMQFWLLTNDVFDAQAAKRLYGFMGTGGILGGITGGLIAMQAKQLGTENLLLVSAGYVFVMVIVFNIIWYMGRKSVFKQSHLDKIKKQHSSSNTKESIKLVRASKYLFLVLLIIMIIKFVTVQTEWQYNKFVEIGVGGIDGRTVFFGKILLWLSYVALGIQLLFTSKVLKKFNFHGALLPLPLGLLIGSIAIIFSPLLASATILKISDGSMRYSINQTATNYLYLPISRQIRNVVKPFFDVCAYQFAKGFGYLFTLFYLWIVANKCLVGEVLQAQIMSYFVAALLILWCVIIYLLKKEYPNEIRKFLKSNQSEVRRKVRLDKNLVYEYIEKDKAKMLCECKDLLKEGHKRSVVIRLAVCIALQTSGQDKESIQRLIRMIMQSEEKAEEQIFSDLGPSQNEVDQLLYGISGEKDAGKRHDVIKTLNKIRIDNTQLDFDAQAIRDAIYEEINDYYRSFTLHELYDILVEHKTDEKDFLKIALQAIYEGNIERIFRLLGLLYNPIDIYNTYQGLHDQNVFVRANALELLDSILDKKIKKHILPVVDGELSLFGPDRAGMWTSKTRISSIDALKRALASNNQWLTVCALFMVGKFKITDLYHDVLKCTHSKDAMICEAALFIHERNK